LPALKTYPITRLDAQQKQRRFIMSLVKWRNGNEILPARIMPNWAANFFKDDDFFDKRWMPAFEMTSPAVNVVETKDAYALEVAAPGMKKDDFKIEVKDGCLLISAETKSEKEQKDDNYTRKEFNYEAFSRSFWLPENTKADSIKATYADGILKLNVPKAKVEKAEPAKLIKIA
jgi:HSP20 family protein